MVPPHEHRLRELLSVEPSANIPEARGKESWYLTLKRLGRAAPIDAETGEFPVDHVSMEDEVLPLAGPTLEGARLEQQVKLNQAFTLAHYTVHLIHGGRRFTTAFYDQGDYCNMKALYGLLNAALEAAGSPLRYVGFGSVAVLGPVEGVVQAVREGLLPLEDGPIIGMHYDANGRLVNDLPAEVEDSLSPEDALAESVKLGMRRVQVSPA
jgi:hypothetical protein